MKPLIKTLVIIILSLLVLAFIVTVPIAHSYAQEIEEIYSSTKYPAFDAYINNGYLYLLGQENLVVLDITEPESPQEIQKIESPRIYLKNIPAGFNDMFVKENYAFVTVGKRRSTGPYYLQVYSIGKDGKLTFVSQEELPKIKPMAEVPVNAQQRLASFLRRKGKNEVADSFLNLPPNEQKELLLDLQAGALGVYVDEKNHAYVAGYGTGLIIFDVSDVHNISMLNSFRIEHTERFTCDEWPKSHSWWFCKKGNIVYFPWDSGGIHILEVSDPRNIKVFDSYNLDGRLNGKCEEYFFNDVDILDSYAYVALDHRGLLVLKISPDYKFEYVTLTMPDYYKNNPWQTSKGTVQVECVRYKDKQLAFLTQGDYGLLIYDITDREQPKIYRDIKIGIGAAWGIHIKDNLIVVCCPWGIRFPKDRSVNSSGGGVMIFRLN